MKDLEQRKYVHHVMDTLQKGDITDNFAQLLIRLGAKINSNILSRTLQEKQKQRLTECIPLLFDQFIGGATIINLNSILDGCNNDPINADLSDALDDISPNGHQQRLKTSVQALYKVLNMEEWAPDAEHFFHVLRKLSKDDRGEEIYSQSYKRIQTTCSFTIKYMYENEEYYGEILCFLRLRNLTSGDYRALAIIRTFKTLGICIETDRILLKYMPKEVIVHCIDICNLITKVKFMYSFENPLPFSVKERERMLSQRHIVVIN
jgi:hypothetical protein